MPKVNWRYLCGVLAMGLAFSWLYEHALHGGLRMTAHTALVLYAAAGLAVATGGGLSLYLAPPQQHAAYIARALSVLMFGCLFAAIAGSVIGAATTNPELRSLMLAPAIAPTVGYVVIVCGATIFL